MMNFVSLCLVVSSLAAAGVWSPSPADQKQQTHPKEEVVGVKEGIRVVVVEYDQQGKHNTKVSIAPEREVKEKVSSAATDTLIDAKDKIKEASSVLPNVGLGISGRESTGEILGHGHGPGELICDAYGKCKHNIASAIEQAKEKASEAAHEVAAKKKEMAHQGIHVVKDAYGEAKDTASEKARGTREAAKDTLGKAKETASEKTYEATEAAKEALGKAKETASQKAEEIKEGAKETIKEARDVGKTIGGDVAENVSEQVENIRKIVAEKEKEAKEGTEHAAERVKTGIDSLFVDRFGKFLRNIGLAEALNDLTGVLNLLGFATAYGMSVWVTFISSYVLAQSLPRQQFGMVQSKIYPVYFVAMACSIGLALLGHMPHMFSNKAAMFQGYNLLTSVLMVFANSMYLEPRASKVMFERLKVEKEEGKGRESLTGETEQRTASDPAAAATSTVETERREQEAVRRKMLFLSERLKKLNTWSSALNIATLMSLNWHLVYLGQRLHISC